MPLIVPLPWRLGTTPVQHGAILRHRLEWVRDPSPGQAPSTVGVVMYNPAGEGEELLILGSPDQVATMDGMTHRRVRGFLASYTSIRVANLSPYRTTLTAECRRWERAQTETRWRITDDQRDAIQWACEAPVVVCAWGGGAQVGMMAKTRKLVCGLAEGRLWCWGETPDGDPLHPSPLGRVPKGAVLARFSP
jgi:hypothetical protein